MEHGRSNKEINFCFPVRFTLRISRGYRRAHMYAHFRPRKRRGPSVFWAESMRRRPCSNKSEIRSHATISKKVNKWISNCPRTELPHVVIFHKFRHYVERTWRRINEERGARAHGLIYCLSRDHRMPFFFFYRELNLNFIFLRQNVAEWIFGLLHILTKHFSRIEL